MYTAPGPAYACASWADHVLSDVRPIKLSGEALLSVNVLLDELLYNILNTARSLETDRLKNALGRVIPTNLGKEVLLEAEVELKAYWERTTGTTPAAGEEAERFDLHWSFEIMRLKCEAYSTMNDTDEDAEAEKRLNERMRSNLGSFPPLQPLLAPAALYLTAILESTCEHVLQNVSHVATRDSSRTIASMHDLFVALCEDESIYCMFKAMKVYDQIEGISRAQEHRPRRSKSFTRSSASDQKLSSPSRTASALDQASSSRVRMSSESVRSGGGEGRASVEKGRMKKLMSHSRSSSEKDAQATGLPASAATASESGRPRASAEFEDDDELAHEFDQLMRSGTTVKVSLTPDRLKSMEVYNKERTQRGNSRHGQRESAPPPDREMDEKAMYAAAATQEQKRPVRERPSLRHVDSIIEDDEETLQQPHTPPPAYVVDPTRARQSSFSTMAISTSTLPARTSTTISIRNRSISISNAPHPKRDSHPHRVGSAAPISSTQMAHHQQNGTIPEADQPQRTRKKQRNRESLDLDDIMNGSGDETVEADEFGQTAAVFPAKEPPAPGRARGSSRADKPYVSQSARELIAFLDEGPPEEPTFPHSITANASVLSFESSKSKSGRFSSMMSRLTIGGSRERLSGVSPLAQGGFAQQLPRSLGRKPSKSNAAPPPSFLTQSLNSKRSMPNVTVITPPRPAAPSAIPHFPLPPPLKVPNPNIALAQQGPFSPVTPHAHATVSTPGSGPSASPTSSQLSFVPSPSMIPGEMSPRRSIRKAVPVFADGERRTLQGLPVAAQATSRTPSPRLPNGQASGYFDASKVRESEKGARDDAPHVVTRVRSKRSLGQPSGNGTLSVRSTESPSISRASSNVSIGKPKSKARESPVEREVEAPKPAPLPTVTAVEVDAFRGMLAGATSADECRLLVDMFFARHGFPFTDASRAVVNASTVIPIGGAYESIPEAGPDLESSLVELFLGGGSVDDMDISPTTTVVSIEEAAALLEKDVATVLSEAQASPDSVRATSLVETHAPLVLAA